MLKALKYTPKSWIYSGAIRSLLPLERLRRHFQKCLLSLKLYYGGQALNPIV